MSERRNIFQTVASPGSSAKRKTSDYVLGEVLRKCVNADCDGADVTRCCATFGGCANYAKNGCKYKISVLSLASPCTTCLVDITPGIPCLGVPNPAAPKSKSRKPGYINNHLNWRDCLGYKVKIGKEGKAAFKFIEKTEAGDARIDETCVHCGVLIEDKDYVISTYKAKGDGDSLGPLHAKNCAEAVFNENVQDFVDAMNLEGLSADKVIAAECLDFAF